VAPPCAALRSAIRSARVTHTAARVAHTAARELRHSAVKRVHAAVNVKRVTLLDSIAAAAGANVIFRIQETSTPGSASCRHSAKTRPRRNKEHGRADSPM
jgi:hypothetical protein